MRKSYHEAFRRPEVGGEMRVPLEQRWMEVVHFGVFGAYVLSPIYGAAAVPLAVGLWIGGWHRGVDDEAYRAFNYGLSLTLYTLVAKLISFFLGDVAAFGHATLLEFPIYIFAFVCLVKAIRSSRKVVAYNYPLTIPFVRHPAGRKQSQWDRLGDFQSQSTSS